MRVEAVGLCCSSSLQSSPEFFVRDVQVALRLHDARVAEHQLNDADVDAVGMQPAGAFVPQVVPAEIDPLELLTIPGGTLSRRSRFDVVREIAEAFPRPSAVPAGIRPRPYRTRRRLVRAPFVAPESRRAARLG